MKKIIVLLAITLLGSTSLFAQTNYEKLLVGTKWEVTEGTIYMIQQNERGLLMNNLPNEFSLSFKFTTNNKVVIEHSKKINKENVIVSKNAQCFYIKDDILITDSRSKDYNWTFHIINIDDKTMNLAWYMGYETACVYYLTLKKLF